MSNPFNSSLRCAIYLDKLYNREEPLRIKYDNFRNDEKKYYEYFGNDENYILTYAIKGVSILSVNYNKYTGVFSHVKTNSVFFDKKYEEKEYSSITDWFTHIITMRLYDMLSSINPITGKMQLISENNSINIMFENNINHFIENIYVGWNRIPLTTIIDLYEEKKNVIIDKTMDNSKDNDNTHHIVKNKKPYYIDDTIFLILYIILIIYYTNLTIIQFINLYRS